jgi:glycosyltransferase involved in cell wall biosynthesis
VNTETPVNRETPPLRVLVLSQYFWPEPIPKPRELAEALRDTGRQVEVVTGFPNYPEGKLYPGYELRHVDREEVGNVPVWRTYLHPDHGRGAAGRLANYGSFMVSAVVGCLLASQFDVMYVWHPPLTVGVTAAIACLLLRRPFVYDVQDIWPESAIASGFLRPGFASRCLSVLEKRVYRRAEHILVVTEGAKENLVGKGVPARKITVVPHWYDDAELRSARPEAREEIRAREGWGGRFVVMFAGNLGMMQGLDTIVRACRSVPPEARVLVTFVGDGSDRGRLQALARELSVEDRIRFVGRVDSSTMAEYFSAADALLVHLRASALSYMVIPTKTIAYFAAGRPVVMANVGASADLVERSKAGVTLPPDDPAALAAAILGLSSLPESERVEMGRRGRLFFEENFTREVTLPKYTSILEAAANGYRR